jgi:hypothetical protein
MAHCIQGKPHIYLHRYSSHLRFRRVRRPKKMHWNNPMLRAAYQYIARLNRELNA